MYPEAQMDIDQLAQELKRTQDELAQTEDELERTKACLSDMLRGIERAAAVLKENCDEMEESDDDERTNLQIGARAMIALVELFRDITHGEHDRDLRVISYSINYLQQKSGLGRPGDLVQGQGASAFRLLLDVGHNNKSACALLSPLLKKANLRNRDGHPVLASHIEKWYLRICYQSDVAVEAKHHYDQMLNYYQGILASLPAEQRRKWAECYVGRLINHLKFFADGQARPPKSMVTKRFPTADSWRPVTT